MGNIQFFNDPDQIPQPKDKIKIESIEVTPYPDRFRVHLKLDVTPFVERPNLLITVVHESGKLVSELTIIETMHANMEFTLHIRHIEDPAGDYTLNAELYYETRNPAQHTLTESFSIPAAEDA